MRRISSCTTVSIVVVQHDGRRVERARAFHAACFDRQHVVDAVAVLVVPLADRVAVELGQDVLGPSAAVGVDAPDLALPVGIDVRDLRRDDDLHRKRHRHDARHAGRQTGRRRIAGQDALLALREILLANGLVLGRQRRRAGLLVALGLPVQAADARPLAAPVGVRIHGRRRFVRAARSGADDEQRGDAEREARALRGCRHPAAAGFGSMALPSAQRGLL